MLLARLLAEGKIFVLFFLCKDAKMNSLRVRNEPRYIEDITALPLEKRPIPLLIDSLMAEVLQTQERLTSKRSASKK